MKQYGYGKQTISLRDKIEVLKVLGSPWLTQGPKVDEFERALCEYTGAKYAVALANGPAALHLSMLAVGLGPDNEAITSPNTFLASANSILYVGGKPVFSDINPETACLDVNRLEGKITKQTRAIVPVHFAGQSCDMDRIYSLINGFQEKIFIIEDAAHAIGTEFKGDKVGNCAFSDMTVFSFHPVKNMTTGEGGAVTTNNQQLYEKLLMLRTHGMTKSPRKLIKNGGPWYYEMHELGYNYRITDIQCALGISQLKRLDDFCEKRRSLVNLYKKLLGIDGRYSFLKEKDYSKSAWHLFPLLINFDCLKTSKIEFFAGMKKKGISLQVHYIPVHLQPYYREKFGYKEGDFVNAESYYAKTVSMPLYPALNRKDVEYIVKSVRECLI